MSEYPRAAIDRLLGRGDKPTMEDAQVVYMAAARFVPIQASGPSLQVARALAEGLEAKAKLAALDGPLDTSTVRVDSSAFDEHVANGGDPRLAPGLEVAVQVRADGTTPTGASLARLPRPTVTKVWILVALRKAEHTHGVGFAGPLERGDVASGKALAEAGLVTLSRRPAPDHGTRAALTEDGRAFVDDLVRLSGEDRKDRKDSKDSKHLGWGVGQWDRYDRGGQR